MDCHRAKELIDLRLNERDSAEAEAPRDWSKLEAHLSVCRGCAAEWEELSGAREMLGSVASDGPTSEEVESMWQAIAMTAGGGKSATKTGRRARILRFAASGSAIAAVLAWAFAIGQMRYSEFGLSLPPALRLTAQRRQAKGTSGRLARMRAEANVKGIGTSAKIYANDSNESWMVPPFHARQERRAAASRVYESDDPNGWSIPVHPSQYESGAYVGAYDWGEEPPSVSRESADTRSSSSDESGQEGLDVQAARRLLPDGSGADQVGPPQPSEDMQSWSFADADDKAIRRINVTSVPAEDVDRLIALLKTSDTRPNRPGRSGEASSRLHILRDDEPGYVIARGPTGMVNAIPELLVALREDGGQGASGDTAALEAQVTPATSKIIKTGTLSLEVASYGDATVAATRLAQAHGGFVTDTATNEQAGGALSGRLTIRVPPERFDDLFTALKTLGRVESEVITAADVTAEYVDLEARIASLELTEKRLAELISNKSFVDKMSSLLEVEREMTRVRSHIEQHQGRLRVMADRVALSTITLSLHEPARAVPSASLVVEVDVLAKAAEKLGQALNESGGRLLSGKTTHRDDGTLRGDYQLRVSLPQFAPLLAEIEALGLVEQRQVSDQQFGDASAPWAKNVQCDVGLVVHERRRQLPGGSMTIEVEKLSDAINKLDTMLASQGAAIVSNHTSRRPDGAVTASASARIPAGRFAAAVEQIASLGRLTGKSISGEAGRIVGGAAGVPCELALTVAERPREIPTGGMVIEVDRFDQARDRLSKLVAEKRLQVLSSSSNQRTDASWAGSFRIGIKSSDMEAVVSNLEQLGRVASRRISGVGLGDLSRIDPNALGVLDLILAEKAAIRPGPERAGDTIRARLRDGMAGLYTSAGLIAYGLIVLAPWLFVVILLAWLVTRVWRRRSLAAAVKTA